MTGLEIIFSVAGIIMIPSITAVFGYGKLSNTVDNLSNKINGMEVNQKLCADKIEDKKLDKEVFEQFVKTVEKNADINTDQHNRIIEKLDILIKEK